MVDFESFLLLLVVIVEITLITVCLPAVFYLSC